jgi:hypothetical protein
MLGYNSRSYVNFILILDKALSSLTEDKFLRKRLTTQMGGCPSRRKTHSGGIKTGENEMVLSRVSIII